MKFEIRVDRAITGLKYRETILEFGNEFSKISGNNPK